MQHALTALWINTHLCDTYAHMLVHPNLITISQSSASMSGLSTCSVSAVFLHFMPMHAPMHTRQAGSATADITPALSVAMCLYGKR